ncbi:MauE/DoxX family redox-associated membrane protein [Flavobacterium sp.]|uniref:MauE/DoxX family redox-associated membrane protein n=1 Tax=Flavobacterium sp. TaxID=239 RepID=UPI003753CDAC
MSFTKNKFKKIFAETIFLFLIAFFCYTALNKLLNLDSFRTNLIKTSLFNIETAKYFSIIVVAWEIIVVALLLFYKKLGLLFFCFTMLLFTLYISFLRFKGLYEVCGCGGVLNGLSYGYHLVINISLLFGGLFLLILNNIKGDEK